MARHGMGNTSVEEPATLAAEMAAVLRQHPDAEPDELATLFVDTVTPDQLRQLLATEFARLTRRHVRSIEQREQAARTAAAQTALTPAGRIHLKWSAELRRSHVSLGAGVTITWGKLTVPQHEMRIAMLAAKRRGIEQTERLHADAIHSIRAAGATCLDDIADGALVAQ